LRRWNIFHLPEILSRAEILALIVFVVIAFVSLLGILSQTSKKYGVETPAYGGSLHEGVVGNPRFINPLLVKTDADRDLVSLIFAGLMRHDNQGNIIPMLAETYEISPDGLDYTVVLKEKLFWSDGVKLTADDIMFTVGQAKNPQTGSTRRPNWEGVETEKIDDRTIQFHLQRAYVPFLENLTLGIIPKHIWESVPPSQFSLVELNTSPIGAGPYKIKSIKRNALGSITNMQLAGNKYFALGKPNIRKLIINFYPNEEEALNAFQRGSLDLLGAISPKYVKQLSERRTRVLPINLQRVIAVFFNKDTQKALASSNIRKALDLGTNKELLISTILENYGTLIDGPLPQNFIAEENASDSNYDPELAKELIIESEREIVLTLTTANTPELVESANLLKSMWEEIGIEVNVKTFDLADLEQLVIGPRRYDAFLYGQEVIGRNPDLFAFWHSSQRAHPGYNIALYANSKTDDLLEDVRQEQDPEKRKEQYTDIQKEIKKDLPAIFLFSPNYIYAIPKNLDGINITSINTGSERFSTIHEWYLERRYVWPIFTPEWWNWQTRSVQSAVGESL
jgi:peptide/nickel transport system substrate-binding protein